MKNVETSRQSGKSSSAGVSAGALLLCIPLVGGLVKLITAGYLNSITNALKNLKLPSFSGFTDGVRNLIPRFKSSKTMRERTGGRQGDRNFPRFHASDSDIPSRERKNKNEPTKNKKKTIGKNSSKGVTKTTRPKSPAEIINENRATNAVKSKMSDGKSTGNVNPKTSRVKPISKKHVDNQSSKISKGKIDKRRRGK